MSGSAHHAGGEPGGSSSPAAAVTPSAALDALGGTATGPRRAILAGLVAVDRLQTPEQILAGARADAPSTSLATVYRTLERLDAAGLIKRAALASGAVGYAYCGGTHHDHAICTRCGRVVRVDACAASAWQPPAGFRVDSHDLNFYGTCEDCAAAPDAAAPDAAAPGR